jgi:hypothetical protein
MDVGSELGFGLEGVKVTQDELRDLVSQLGLGGDAAEDLISGLGNPGDKARVSNSNSEATAVKPSTIVQAQPKPLAPLRPKSSKASSLHKERLKDSTPAPPTPKIEETPVKPPSPSPPKVIERSVEEEKAPEPSPPSQVDIIEQVPAATKVEPTAFPPPPAVKEPEVVREQSTPVINSPETTHQKEPVRDLPPIRMQETVRRMSSNRSEETLAVDSGSPTTKDGIPCSPMTPLTPQTIVAGLETSKLLYKSTEPLSAPTMSRGLAEKFEEVEQKESA